MSDCSQHKKEVAGISDMKQLAEMIGDLHYESFAQLLEHLSDKLLKDYRTDTEAGRKQLGLCLFDASVDLKCSSRFIHRAWQISKPFMKPNS